MNSPSQIKIIKLIFESLPGDLRNADRVPLFSKEIPFHDVYGEAYLSMSIKHVDNSAQMIHVEKYYESEFLQDEYGTVKNIPINWDNPQETINTILNIIKQWTGNTKIANSLNWYKVASK